jgi:uncharacterized repeat protein (TIGR01451 family)
LNQKTALRRGLWIAGLTLVIGFAAMSPASAELLYGPVVVSDTESGDSIDSPNTSRNVAVAPDGIIHVCYHGTNGVRVTRSTNRGQSFAASKRLTTTDAECEIAVDKNGIVYVAWADSGNAMLSRSTNKGVSYSTAADVGDVAGASFHIATDAPHVYLLQRNGNKLLRNANNGVGAFQESSPDSSRVYSDIHVDPVTGYVYVQTDDPTVRYTRSTDHGATFAAITDTGEDVYYSTAVMAASDAGSFLYISGSATAAFRINMDTDDIQALTFGNNTNNVARTLAVDELGNVVDGYRSGSDVMYAVSDDQGATFDDPVTVAEADYMSLAINRLYGDIVAVYETGGVVYAKIYGGEIPQGEAQADLEVTVTAAPNPPVTGENLTYTIAVENLSYSAASNVEITVELPDNVTFDTADDGCTNAAGTVTCVIAGVGAGATETRDITVFVPYSAAGALALSVAVDSDTTDPDEDNNTDSISLTAVPGEGAETVAPTGSITVNAGEEYTDEKTVALALTAEDNFSEAEDMEMRLSLNADFSGADWETFGSEKVFTLGDADGTYTIYFQLRDEWGNLSEVYSSTIILDAAALSLTPTKVGGTDFDPATNSYSVQGSTVTITGNTKPMADVTVTLHSDPMTCTTESDGAGDFSCTFEGVAAGLHTVAISAVDRLGRTIDYPSFGVEVVIPGGIAPTGMPSALPAALMILLPGAAAWIADRKRR